MNMAKLLSAFAIAAVALLDATVVVANDPVTINDSVYSEEQAARGEPLFDEHCASCHDAEFFKNSLSKRANQPVANMVGQIMATMPLTAPGLLQDQEYEDIFAYILETVGFPAGDSDLTFASGDMNTIVIKEPE